MDVRMCGTCTAFYPETDGESDADGSCRLFPPQNASDGHGGIVTAFPLVNRCEYCMQWREKPTWLEVEP